MSAVIDFESARARLQVEHSIEIDAARIPVVDCVIECEIDPVATYLERFNRSLNAEELAELVRVTLEECK